MALEANLADPYSEKLEQATELVGSYSFLPPTGIDPLVRHADDSPIAASNHTVLVGELHHRLQNTLSIVLALSRLTARTVNTLDEFQVAFCQRIEAMARTNALLLRGQVQAVSVQSALEAELHQYLDDNGQVTLICDALEVSPDAALSLSLIFHELATNAVKYGALARPDGRLVISCRQTPLGAALHWQEFVTTPLTPSLREGSGSLLITRLTRSLGGSSRVEIRPGGLDVEITFKLDDGVV
jgi:two-component sensor histidine kinase